MANSEIGTSTSNSSGGSYGVFLSFRGPDTRIGFASCLYHALVDVGIRVFIDDEELRPGERISGNLLQAIDDSKLYIPIFSKNYASSHWCLRELAKMVENTSKSKEDGKEKFILPIFYDVKPMDVKLKTSLYSEAISNLEARKKFSSEDVKTWRKALEEVGGIMGQEREKYNKGEGELIRSVVHEVLVKLETRQKQVTKNLVGMEDYIAAIMNHLDIESGGVQLIGISGMGGIGKTTLAKIIFNQLCPRFGKNCSFLDDVREMAKTKGLDELRKKLLSDISPSRVPQNINNNTIGETICNKKVLIVLDDVDDGNQIRNLMGGNSLCPGTIIIVTTRDRSVLNVKEFEYKFKDYEMVPLSFEDALKLFCRHAFNDDSPAANYGTLPKSIVSTTGGLPLAVEVIGSSLNGEEKEIWEERLQKLKETPHEDVLAKLRISYDALQSEQQQIFLDIACLFVGKKKTNPMHVWEVCKFYPKDAIKVLVKRCMIGDLDDDRFKMHDQLRNLGRRIAKEGGTILWDQDDIICKLKSIEIKGSVQALSLQWHGFRSQIVQFQRHITITSEQIKRFPHLRLLSLYQVICQGDFTDSLFGLKWIKLTYTYCVPDRNRCNQYLEATNLLHLENAVVVNLAGLDITEDAFENLIEVATKLKVLTIEYNSLIHGALTFPGYSVLEKLTIKGFSSLTEIDCSIGKLRWLTDLSFESCRDLQKLPDEIGELQELRHLSLRSCYSLSELPDSISKLKSLMKLDVSRTAIRKLPDKIGRLPSLSSADVSFTPIAEMPRTMSKFRQLTTLDLDCCDGIQELPKLPRSLTTLRLRSTSLRTVPDLSYLTDLVELVLSDGSDLESRSHVMPACDLQWIGRLFKLSKLRFCFSSVRAPTTELGSLSLLKELTLYGLDLPTFEHLPSNLTVLELYDTREKQVQLDELPQLEKETDTRGKRVQLEELPQLEKETDTRGKRVRLDELPQLEKETDTRGKRVRLDELPQLEKETAFDSTSSGESSESVDDKDLLHLELQFLHSTISLETKRNQAARKSHKRLVCPPKEPECNELQAPVLIDQREGAFLFPSSQKMLQELLLSGFPEVQDIQFVSAFESLEEFSVEDCSSLKSLGGLSNLKNLKRLVIGSCESLQVVEGINELEFLHRLEIIGCGSMESIFDASNSKIPDQCMIHITRSGELLDCGNSIITWVSYKDKILNGTEQASRHDSGTETTDSETETTDPETET